MSDLERALQGDLTGWAGLPELLPADFDAEPGALLEQARLGTRYLVLDRSGFRVWFPHDASPALWLELPEPALPVDSVLASIGEPPERSLPSRRPFAGATTEDLVWPGRGIAVTVATPIGEGLQQLAHLVLFRTMPFEDYLTSAGVAPSVRPFGL